MEKPKPTRRLTLYLFEESVKEFDQAIEKEKPKAVKQLKLSEDSGLDGVFFYSETASKKPEWTRFVEPLLEGALPSLENQNNAAVLLLKQGGRIFAVTFGFGRSILNLSRIEPGFGLRVALNIVDPKKLRSLSRKSYDSLVISTSTQASRSTSAETFNPDDYREIWRAVAGEVKDDALMSRVGGADSLVLNAALDPGDLSILCNQVLASYKSDLYRKRFPWVDQLTMISAKPMINKLDDLLLKELKSENQDSHLAAPENIEWEEISYFKIQGARAHQFQDLDLQEYLRIEKNRDALTIEKLKRKKVTVCFSRSGVEDTRWSFYDCLVSEQRLGGQLFALVEGRWFKINESLVDEVDKYLRDIPDFDFDFEPGPKNEPEKSFNARIADSSNGYFLNLDATNYAPTGATTKIEMCDLLGKNKELVHVKRKSHSATLSHLFSQGLVSLAALSSDGKYRQKMRNSIEKKYGSKYQEFVSLLPNESESFASEEYTVCYVVVSDSDKSERDWLPFFSKLNLMFFAQSIKERRAGVKLLRVPTTGVDDPTYYETNQD